MRCHGLLLATATIVLSVGSLSAQSLSSSLGWDTFVEGLSPVENAITLENPPQEVTRVAFDIDGTPATTLLDATREDGFTARFDMGKIHADPNAHIRAICFNAAGVPVDTIGHMIAVIPTPYWMRSSAIDHLAVTADSITFDVSYPLGGAQHSRAGIGMLGAGALGIEDAALDFHVSYDFRAARAEVRDVRRRGTLDLFGRARRSMTLPLTLGSAKLDAKLDLELNGNQQEWDQSFILDQLRIPMNVERFPEMRVDAGVVMRNYVAMSANVGHIGSRSGAIRDAEGYTVTDATAQGFGFQRGAVQSLITGVPMSGSLVVQSLVNARTIYSALPEDHYDTSFGGDLRISGHVQARPFWQFAAGRSGTDLPAGSSYGPIGHDMTFGSLAGSAAVTALAVILGEEYDLPTSWPQPRIDANASYMDAVWIETGTPRGRLLLATLNPDRSLFSGAQEIVSNANSIGSPDLKIASDGSALVAWTQSRYDANTAPENLPLDALARSQDVWYSWYDALSGRIALPTRMRDDTSGFETGRADGAPSVCQLGPDSYMVAWSGTTGQSDSSHLWYSIITRSGESLTATEPALAATVKGYIQSPKLLARPSGGALLTAMINPSTTVNVDMVNARWNWDGSSWKSASAPAYQRTALLELEGASDGTAGVVGMLAREYDVSGAYHPAVIIHGWSAGQEPMSAPYADIPLDSATDVGQITASMQSSGLAVVSFQQFAKTRGDAVNQGRRVFYVQDLNISGEEWRRLDAPAAFSDTAAFVWDATAGLIRDGEYYLVTQEYGPDGVNLQPTDGALFYTPEPALVLHHARVSALGTLLVEAPAGVTDTEGRDAMKQLGGESIAVVPNPVVGTAKILFDLPGTGAVRVEIFDMQGSRVALLADEQMVAGPHALAFRTDGLATGAYMVRVNLEGIVHSRVVTVFNEGR